MAFGWFIYDVNYNGLPTIDWIWIMVLDMFKL
jgi:hypothetical protein